MNGMDFIRHSYKYASFPKRLSCLNAKMPLKRDINLFTSKIRYDEAMNLKNFHVKATIYSFECNFQKLRKKNTNTKLPTSLPMMVDKIRINYTYADAYRSSRENFGQWYITRVRLPLYLLSSLYPSGRYHWSFK